MRAQIAAIRDIIARANEKDKRFGQTQKTVTAKWIDELAAMRDRIKSMRLRLVAGLEAAGITDMGFIATQVGMFSYSGLTRDQMIALRAQHGVYGTDKGRICVAALNEGNVEYVCRAIAEVRGR